MTVGEALVTFLDNQYVSFDGRETKLVEAVYTVFGHGCVVGTGEALAMAKHGLKVYQGKNEQGMAHAATSYAKHSGRLRIIPCMSSIGPGSANMVTAAATATANNLPLLLLLGDTFATRQPDPVLQQIEQPYSATVTTNDAFRAVTRYFDRVSRPEMLMTAMLNAVRVLLDPALTGAVAIALPQDVRIFGKEGAPRGARRPIFRGDQSGGKSDQKGEKTVARRGRRREILGGGRGDHALCGAA